MVVIKHDYMVRIRVEFSTYISYYYSTNYLTLLGGSDNRSDVCSDLEFNKLYNLKQLLVRDLKGELPIFNTL